MKTIQISDELWKRLRIEAAVKGVTMREVVSDWLTRGGEGSSARSVASQLTGPGPTTAETLRRQIEAQGKPVKELKVERAEDIP
jgi:hypothetical protein